MNFVTTATVCRTINARQFARASLCTHISHQFRCTCTTTVNRTVKHSHGRLIALDKSHLALRRIQPLDGTDGASSLLEAKENANAVKIHNRFSSEAAGKNKGNRDSRQRYKDC